MDHDHVCGVSKCGRPTLDVICSSHTDELVAALMSVATHTHPSVPGGVLSLASSLGLWDELEVTLTRQHKLAVVSAGGKSDDTPVMFHEAASEARSGIQRFVWYWAYQFWGFNEHLSSPPKTVPAACAWLAQFPGLIASLPDAGAMWEDMTRETQNAARVIDAAPSRVYLGQCGGELEIGVCDQHLYSVKGKPTVKCPSCGAVWDAESRQAQLVALVEDKTVNTVEVCRLLGAIGIEIAQSRVSRYAKARTVGGVEIPPRIVPVGRDGRGRPKYRVGDVLNAFLADLGRVA
ncbi:hypothetical protein AB0383_20335 [Amycolatopsis sp. NPDC051373]|uniref:hypothetical protein n=1 Tax=Amycolatopsis sp. NPDC051373 TaxID=3155801 RepID=UPI00344CBC5F